MIMFFLYFDQLVRRATGHFKSKNSVSLSIVLYNGNLLADRDMREP